MAKGPYLTPWIESQLKDIYSTNPQIKPKEARESLLGTMKGEHLDEIFGPDFPSRSAVSKTLKNLRDKDAARPDELKDLDKPWSVAAMANHSIPAETLPVILTWWSRIMEKAPRLVPQAMTIRIALWMGRLYYVFKEQMPLGSDEIPEDKRTEPESWLPGLYLYSLIYAHYERVIELGKYPGTYEDASVLWLGDAELAGNQNLRTKLEEDIFRLSVDSRLLATIVQNLAPALDIWCRVVEGNTPHGKKTTNQGKCPRHIVKSPKDKTGGQR